MNLKQNSPSIVRGYFILLGSLKIIFYIQEMLILPKFPRDYSSIERLINKIPLNNPIVYDPNFSKSSNEEFELTNIEDIVTLNIKNQFDVIKWMLSNGWQRQSIFSRGDEEYSSINLIHHSYINQKLILVSSATNTLDCSLQSIKWEIAYIEWIEEGGWTNAGSISDPKVFKEMLEQIINISKMVYSTNINDQNLAKEIIKNQFINDDGRRK